MIRPPPIVIEQARVLARAYQVDVSANGAWVRVGDLVLPPDFNVPTTAVLIGMPPDFPHRPPGILPHGLYVTPGLRYRGQPLFHVVEGRGPGWGSWSWVCLTRIDWRPTDDLLRVLEIVRTVLSIPVVR